MGKLHTILLILILSLALFLRVFGLDKVPVALFGDEVDVGYQAYSILKTGKDLYGNTMPVLMHSLSEYRAPLYIYSAVPFVGIFGLNEWGVRIPAAFWGMLSIVGIYLLAKRLFNPTVSLFAVFFLALSPWHIQYSRASFEVTMLLAFIVFGTYFFLLGLTKKWYLLLSAAFFALTPYIYSTAVVFMPLLLIILGAVYFKDLRKKVFFPVIIGSLVLALILLIPYILQTFSGKSGERFSIISIFTNQELEDKVTLIQKSRGEENVGFEKLFHNKPIVWLQTFSLNYLRSFSPEFLFLQGDPNFRHSIHEMGEMYYFEIILLLLGLYLLIRLNTGQKWLILGWLLIAPVPAALTTDGGFHATRTFLMLVPLGILVSLGGEYLWENRKKWKIKYLNTIILVLLLFNTTFFLHRYFVHYPIESWLAWHYGFKEAMQYVKLEGDRYQKVLINNTYEPSLIRFLFWNKYDPASFHQNFKGDQPLKDVIPGFNGFSLEDKYYFGKLESPVENYLKTDTLYLASGRDDITNPATVDHSNIKLLRVIYSFSSLPIFFILTGESNEQ